MKKIILALFFILLGSSLCFAEKTYLFENYYYGMTKTEIEKNETLFPIKGYPSSFLGEKYFYLENKNTKIYLKFFISLSFDEKQKLKGVSLQTDLSSLPDNYYGFDTNTYATYKVMEYINSFAVRFLYVMNDKAFLSSNKEEFDNAIKNRRYLYYAIGKDLYKKISKKTDGTLQDFLKNIKKTNRVIEVSFLDNYLTINFKTFKDIYKDGEPLYIGAKVLMKNFQ